jgi:hypothetical protein
MLRILMLALGLGGAVGFGFEPPANMEGRDLFTSLSCSRDVQAWCNGATGFHEESGSSFGTGNLQLRVTANEAGIVPTGRKVVVEFPFANGNIPEWDSINDFAEFGSGFPFVTEFSNEYQMTSNEIGGGSAKFDVRVLGSELDIDFTYDGPPKGGYTCADGSQPQSAQVSMRCNGFAF